MATYAQVINNNGTVSIDDTTARLVKTRSVPLSGGYTALDQAYYYMFDASSDFVLGSYSVFSITLKSNESLVAVRALKDHANVMVLGSFVSAKTYKIYLWGSRTDLNTYASDFVVDVYGTVPSENISKSGLKIYNDSGVKIFDSDYYYLDVAGIYDSVNAFTDGRVHYFNDFDDTVSIGGYTRKEHAVIINSAAKSVCMATTMNIMLVFMSYGVVFNNNSIYLKKMGTGAVIYSDDDISPYGMTGLNSGIIINTQNIS